MSGGLVGGVIGAAIGFFASGGNPLGAMYGFSIGSAVGGMLSSGPAVEGPRLTDLKPQSSEYGRPIPIVYGTVGMGGNVIWASDYIEEKSESGGDKGSPTVTSYSYFGNFAVAFCEGERAIGRMWAGPERRLIWDGAKLEGGGKVRFYTGSEDQLPDPLIESYLGVGNVPAFRGTTYVVFEHFPLAKDGNALPFITAEIGATTGSTCPAPARTVTVDGVSYSVFEPTPVKVADTGPAGATYGRSFFEEVTGLIYYTYKDSAGTWWIDRADPSAGYIGTPLQISTGGGVLNIASNNGGLAAAVVDGTETVYYVDLLGWQISGTEIKTQHLSSGSASADVPVKMSDVVWDAAHGTWHFLGWLNTVSGYDYGVPGIFPSIYAWGVGERVGGSLTPIGDGAAYGFATNMNSQPSDYASEPGIYWNAFDTKRQILVDFGNGVYNYIGTNTYINTSDFGLGVIGDGGAVYSEAQDRFYVAQGLNILIFDPEKLTPEHWPHEDCILFQGGVRQAYADNEPINTAGFSMRLVIDPADPDWLYVVTGAGQIMKINVAIDGVATQNGVTLAHVVSDLSRRAGLTSAQIDVSALTDIVDGYTIARQTTVRNAIDALRPAYFFDAVESEGKIKYVKRGGAPVGTIDVEDLDARSDGQAPGDPLLTTRQMEVELPRVVNVNYLSAATDYQPATKSAKRLVGASGNEITLDLALVLTDTKAQQIADANLQLAWVQRINYTFSMPRKYSEYESTDHIVVNGHGMRITKTNRTPQGVTKCEAVADGASHYISNSVTTETPPNEQTVYVPGTTLLELM